MLHKLSLLIREWNAMLYKDWIANKRNMIFALYKNQQHLKHW